MTRETRVGLTVLLGVLCAGVLVVFLGRFHFASPGYKIQAAFGYVDSLKPSAPVLYGGGVKIGTVDSLAITEGRVRVQLHIYKEVKIPANSVITIHTSGILGEKYIQVSAGDERLGVLAPGTVVQGLDPGSLDRTLQRVEALADVLEPLLMDPKFKKGVSGVMASLNRVVDELGAIVTENKGDLRVSISNLKELTGGLKARSEELKPLLSSASGMINEKNKKALEQSLTSLQSITTKLDKVLTQIDAQKGTVGTLVYDEETAENLRTLLRDLKRHPWKLLWKK
jgi:phospholipid/cholesterol/gamma-HCH transport system substrate-binding protein